MVLDDPYTIKLKNYLADYLLIAWLCFVWYMLIEIIVDLALLQSKHMVVLTNGYRVQT